MLIRLVYRTTTITKIVFRKVDYYIDTPIDFFTYLQLGWQIRSYPLISLYRWFGGIEYE
jgi:hypothetical protein